MPIETGSLSLGALVGILIGTVASHYLTKSRNSEERQFKMIIDASENIKNASLNHQLASSRNIEAIRITEFNKGAAEFRSAFVDTIYLLRQNKDSGSDFIKKIITPDALISHEKAKILFEPFIDESAFQGFTNAWDNYANCQFNYYAQVASSHDGVTPLNADLKDMSNYCLIQIDNLMQYAKPHMA